MCHQSIAIKWEKCQKAENKNWRFSHISLRVLEDAITQTIVRNCEEKNLYFPFGTKSGE